MSVRKFKKIISILMSFDGLWYRGLLSYRVAPTLEHVQLLGQLRPDLIIDVGANRGQFALAALKVLPNANVTCFEPLNSAFAVLSSLFRGNDRVLIHKTAIGDLDSEIAINISNREDSSSLLSIGNLQTESFPGTHSLGTEVVSVRRLSNLVSQEVLAKTTLLKIDVQGFELQVLQGAAELLDKIEFIYVECSFMELYKDQALASDIISFLFARGFRLNGVHNTSVNKKGIAVQADFLFANKKLI